MGIPLEVPGPESRQQSIGAGDQGLIYDAAYYEQHCGIPYGRTDHWFGFFGRIAETLIDTLKPQRVLDAGCAWGLLVEAFRDRGVEARGLDISPYAIGKVRPDMQPYCRVASLTEPIKDFYDLITCIEVLEHMPEEEANQAIRNLCQATDAILFSSTPSDFTEPTHVNVRPVVSWLGLFSEHGFAPDPLYDASVVSPHAFLLRRGGERLPAIAPVLFEEKLRVQAEKRRVQDENLHIRNEKLQVQAENQRIQAENLQVQAENLQVQAENQRLHAENQGIQTENERIQTENERIQAENQRIQAENQRIQAENQRIQAENQRIQAENQRIQAENQRIQAELAGVAREREIWIQTANVQTERAKALTRQLDDIQASPGWRFIRKYRDWLQFNREFHPWVVRRVEPIAKWFLQRGAKEAQPAPSSQASTGPMPVVRLERATTSSYQDWILEQEPDEAGLALQREIAASFSYRPKISIIVPVYKVPFEVLNETIASVAGQTYRNWELCLTHADPDATTARQYLGSLAERDKRIKVRLLSENRGISGNSNQALELATGEFIALLDHDDTLAPFALFEVVRALNEQPSIDFLYSDRDELGKVGNAIQRMRPLLKPQWSPEILLSVNYLTHFCVIAAERVRAIGGWREETDGAQDWDLFLRAAGDGKNVRHIPKVLYHWRQSETSVAALGLAAKPWAAEGQLRTVRDHCGRQGWNVDVAFDAHQRLRVLWKHHPGHEVSVILVSADAGVQTLSHAQRLLTGSACQPTEIVLCTTLDISSTDPRIRILRVPAGSSVPERISRAVEQSIGETLVFVDEGADPADEDWLSELAGPLQNREIGIVGAKLLREGTATIQHAGIVFTDGTRLEYIFAGEPADLHAEFGAAGWYRNWTAVSGACFSMRREVWVAAGGVSGKPRYPRLDVDLCLRVQVERGLRVVYNPYARLFQSRPSVLEGWLCNVSQEAGDRYIQECFPGGDPYFHPQLTCREGKIRLRSRAGAGGNATGAAG
jgi:cellulose synthase/poly-beta-1,6-N-acetylglucosamine synthase-like glycosyltransferase